MSDLDHKCYGCLELLQKEESAEEQVFYFCRGCENDFCDNCSCVIYPTEIRFNSRRYYPTRLCFQCKYNYQPFMYYLLGKANFASLEEAWTTFEKANSAEPNTGKRKLDVSASTEAEKPVADEC